MASASTTFGSKWVPKHALREVVNPDRPLWCARAKQVASADDRDEPVLVHQSRVGESAVRDELEAA
jgi:hypothetical protein